MGHADDAILMTQWQEVMAKVTELTGIDSFPTELSCSPEILFLVTYILTGIEFFDRAIYVREV